MLAHLAEHAHDTATGSGNRLQSILLTMGDDGILIHSIADGKYTHIPAEAVSKESI